MKNTFLGSILGLGLLSATFAPALSAQTPICEHILDAPDPDEKMWSKGVNFEDKSAFIGGVYDKQFIKIACEDLDYQQFTFNVRFKPKVKARMPVMVLGVGCRSAAFYLTAEGFVELRLNNSDIVKTSQMPYQTMRWQTATFTYDQESQTAAVYLDGKLAISVNAEIDLACIEKYEARTLFTSTNYSNGDTFNGWLRVFRVYNEIFIPKALPTPAPQP